MTESMKEEGLRPIDMCRNEIIEIFNDPVSLSGLVEYFKHNKKIVSGKEVYSCNGWHCDCSLGRSFAMLKYIAQLSEYRCLTSDSLEIQLSSIQNAYYYSYNLPVDEISFVKDASHPNILIDATLFPESKALRIEDLGLGEYLTLSDIEG